MVPVKPVSLQFHTYVWVLKRCEMNLKLQNSTKNLVSNHFNKTIVNDVTTQIHPYNIISSIVTKNQQNSQTSKKNSKKKKLTFLLSKNSHEFSMAISVANVNVITDYQSLYSHSLLNVLVSELYSVVVVAVVVAVVVLGQIFLPIYLQH